MFFISGADGREYGPVTPEQLREWIAQGLANAQSKVRQEGVTEWKALADFPEFAVQPGAQPLTTGAPPAFPTGIIPKTNSMAIAGMIMGILSVTLGCCCYGLPFNVAGIVCSGVALSQISKDPVNQQSKNYAIAGLVLSILSVLLAGLFLVLGVAANWKDVLRNMRRL